MDDLNVFKYGYLMWRHPYNWIENIKQFFTNVKRAWHRAKYGYCDVDLYDLSKYYSRLFENSLKDFAENLYSYPLDTTEEEWTKTINRMVSFFNHYNQERDNINKFASDFYNMRYDWSILNNRKTLAWIGEGSVTSREKLTKKFIAEDKRIHAEQLESLRRGMELMYENFENLWI